MCIIENMKQGKRPTGPSRNQGESTKMNKQQIEKLISQGYKAVVVVDYNYADKEQGELISKHKTEAAADKKASQSTFWAVRFLTDLL